MDSTSLLGRERERRAIRDLLAPDDTGPRVVALVGVPGSGRTSLAALAGRMAVDAGRRVLTVAGLHGEEGVPLAGLSHLLLPSVDQISSLPEAHRRALERPLGLVSDAEPFDLVATGMAVLALMMLRPDSPLLVAVDDADRVDDETLSVLAFVAKRIDRRRAVLLMTVEPGGVPAQFDRNVTRVEIARLDDRDSHRLLDARGPDLEPTLRARVVAQSAGSPLALLETAAAAVASPPARPARGPLRVGPLIEERVMARVRQLPPETRERLVDAAVAESFGARAAGRSPLVPDGLAVLEPAERAGVVRIDRSGVSFTHPAFWIAIFHQAPFALRIDAHRRVAETITDEPTRRAWHLGHASVGADDGVAELLLASADDIGRQLGRLEKALALERAAELSSDDDDRARRFLAAAGTAAATGELDWVDELTDRAKACVRDPALRVKATTRSAWASAARGRFSAAMADLADAADESVGTAPEAAWEVLSIAAAVGYQSGSRGTHGQMQAAIRQLDGSERSNDPAPARTPVAEARRLWIESFLRPGAGTAERIERLAHLSVAGPTDEPSLSRLAGAAWLDDETEAAVTHAESAYDRLSMQGSHAAAAVIGPIRSWGAWDQGRWDDALEYAADTTRVAEAAGGGMLTSTGDAVAALVFAARGDDTSAEARATGALERIRGEECLSIVARVAQARGLGAIAVGDYTAAYASFARMFREDGTPLHWHISYFGIADLAAAAHRSEQVGEARTLLARVLESFPAEPATRLLHLMLRAQALLADDDDAEGFFERAHRDAAGSRWPFERAQLLLDYGAWLRRRKRIGEAKPLLARAHDLFDGLGAVPWRLRAESELRASHVDVAPPSGTLDELTGQQREIVLLAGQGLTNREIAARMYLSPRTVASHLYRSFPKLGIRDRWQLRDLIERGDVQSSDRTLEVQ